MTLYLTTLVAVQTQTFFRLTFCAEWLTVDLRNHFTGIFSKLPNRITRQITLVCFQTVLCLGGLPNRTFYFGSIWCWRSRRNDCSFLNQCQSVTNIPRCGNSTCGCNGGCNRCFRLKQPTCCKPNHWFRCAAQNGHALRNIQLSHASTQTYAGWGRAAFA